MSATAGVSSSSVRLRVSSLPTPSRRSSSTPAKPMSQHPRTSSTTPPRWKMRTRLAFTKPGWAITTATWRLSDGTRHCSFTKATSSLSRASALLRYQLYRRAPLERWVWRVLGVLMSRLTDLALSTELLEAKVTTVAVSEDANRGGYGYDIVMNKIPAGMELRTLQSGFMIRWYCIRLYIVDQMTSVYLR